jgi:hypothetical protein
MGAFSTAAPQTGSFVKTVTGEGRSLRNRDSPLIGSQMHNIAGGRSFPGGGPAGWPMAAADLSNGRPLV